MGHGNSKAGMESSSDESARGDGSSRADRIKKKLHLSRSHFRRHHRHAGATVSSAHNLTKLLKEEDFAGIALLRLITAEMQFKDKWLACVTLGEQTFRTCVTDQTDKPTWNSEKKLLLEKNGAHIARISVFETNRLSKNNLVGYCEIDLLEFLTQDSDTDIGKFDLFDPSSKAIVGTITLSCFIEDPMETEKNFARRILSIVDYNEDGNLSFNEFSDLIDAFGNQLAANKKKELFRAADKNGDGVVCMDELAELLAVHQEKEPLITCCPVCGEILEVPDRLNSMIHLTLCFDEGTGNQVMTGGFLIDKQAANGWMFKLTEWAHFSSYDIGLRSGSSASHILVFDRRKKRLVEELIDSKIVLSMRAIYQSKVGLGVMDQGAKDILQSMSEKQGKKMDSVESAKDIPKFVEFFKDQLNLDEAKYPLEHFKTFNEFFIRELKPGARPIAHMECDDIAVCAADCRLMAFKTADDSLRFWIKGRKFSIRGLLGNEACSSAFIEGTLVIFRLAPQDYHRFHSPVSGTIEMFVNIPGCLYTVNPIAVNSKYCNVFTENKRVVCIISTADFGKVAFVAIGATMVGSITFSKKLGEYVQKGDELGYFSFGGSTVICVFEKDRIKIDEDLLENSERSLETLVSVGMQLGISTKKKSDVGSSNMEKLVLQA
ncbi:phosphatidylserine decarboxylase proenzyme 2 isoform X1 [Coffea arabica]|uniref:Phosphatidylserine decarboxylase proenzyme 2 n=1 Tax=Coffea arabica TaxID=13443 RepID=A0A6P6VUT9_COFAR|nr:phosphatidylserine decarboxylase proenzyme 2-like isoform X1 [Coffea arabica]XP_027106337.1 phosphatidylserine decarboxylase proenzyme 2-like isoform X1 [Coffea arabica]